MADDTFDLVVLGAGAVGENVADYAARRGLSVAVVEEELVGGECSYWACMPSKALLRSGDALTGARRVPGAAEAVTGDLDVAAVLRRRDSFTSGWDDSGQVEWLEGAGITLLRGHARITGVREVDVDGRTVRARAAVAVATGSVPTLPDVPGLAAANPWSTREATATEAVPRRLVVVGGGVAGTELATAYARLGSTVTVLSRSGLLGSFEPFVGQAVEQALRDLGVDVRTGVSPARVARQRDGSVLVEVPRARVGGDGQGGDRQCGDGQTGEGATDRIAADELLVATGGEPRVQDLGLDAVGVHPDRLAEVDDTMLVPGTDWLYAVGDVNGRAPLTHQGKYQARAAGEAIAARHTGTTVDEAAWGAHVATADRTAVPQVVFTDPQVAAVGLTEAAARAAGLRVRAVEHDLGAVAGASLYADGYTGRAKAVVDEDRSVLVGVTLVGQDVAELLHAATVAVVGQVPLDRLWHAVPAYPTISEVWLRLLEAYGRP